MNNTVFAISKLIEQSEIENKKKMKQFFSSTMFFSPVHIPQNWNYVRNTSPSSSLISVQPMPPSPGFTAYMANKKTK